MSRARRHVTVLRPRESWALFAAFFPRRHPPIFADVHEAVAFERAAKGVTRPSILRVRGALLGRPISARAAARLLARLDAA